MCQSFGSAHKTVLNNTKVTSVTVRPHVELPAAQPTMGLSIHVKRGSPENFFILVVTKAQRTFVHLTFLFKGDDKFRPKQ